MPAPKLTEEFEFGEKVTATVLEVNTYSFDLGDWGFHTARIQFDNGTECTASFCDFPPKVGEKFEAEVAHTVVFEDKKPYPAFSSKPGGMLNLMRPKVIDPKGTRQPRPTGYKLADPF